jgi:hypothetical protein
MVVAQQRGHIGFRTDEPVPQHTDAEIDMTKYFAGQRW